MLSKRTELSKSILVPVLLLIITASYLFLSFQQDLRSSIPTLIGVTAVVTASLAGLLYEVERTGANPPASFLLIGALCFRLLFLFRAPELSDDIYRYLWDGLQTLQGVNPYSAAPDAFNYPDGIRAGILQRMNHSQYITIYPPTSQLVYAGGALIFKSVTGLKAILAILDMATCFMILKILALLRLPSLRAALYAWHPLPVVEISGSGHVDGVGILFLLIAIYIFVSQSNSRKSVSGGRGSFAIMPGGGSILAGTALAASVLTKFIPLIYIPVIFMAKGSLRLVLGFATGLVLLSLPFMPDLYRMVFTLGAYLKNWEFSNFLFRTVRDLTSSGGLARILLSCAMLISLVYFTVSYALRQNKSHISKPDFLLMKTLYCVTFSFLLLTPTLHPWYVLYLAALLPFAAGPAGMILSWAVFLAYHVTIRYSILGEWTENGLIAAAIWLAPFLAASAAFVAKKFHDSLRSRTQTL